MIIRKMFKLILNLLFLHFFITTTCIANEDFATWLDKFQTRAINSGISDKVVKDIIQKKIDENGVSKIFKKYRI